MKSRLGSVVAILCTTALLAGCVGTSGGLAPSPLPATTTADNTVPPAPPPGTIVAGVIGGTVGLSLTTADRNRALSAEYQALEFGLAGTPVLWQGSTTSIYGEVVPGPFYSVNEYECRDYTHTLYFNGVREAGRGSACRTAGGPWTPVI